MNFWTDIIGATSGYLRLGKSGVRLQDASGTLNLRNADNSADAAINASSIALTGATPIVATNITAPATPATGKTNVYVDSSTKKLASKDDAGIITDYGLAVSAISFLGQATSEAESTTTSVTFVPKIAYTTTGIVSSGNFKVDWYYEITNSNLSKDTFVEVLVNSVVVSEDKIHTDTRDEYIASSGFFRFSASANIPIEINFRTEINTATAKIRRARLYITKE